MRALAAASLVCLFTACSRKDAGPPWAVDPSAVVGAAVPQSDSVRINVYLDGTTSMGGYTVDGRSVYDRFLEDSEDSFLIGWKRADVHYYKFGTIKRELSSRAQLREAKTTGFYHEHGLSETTNIDLAIDCKGGRQIGIIVTDLFQSEGDVNALVRSVKDRCFANGVAMGILAMRSQFRGTVYDARVPPYPYASTEGRVDSYRPVYALMFGDETSLRHLFESLPTNHFAEPPHLLLISNHVVRAATVTMTKARDAKDLNANSAPGALVSAFNLRKGGSGGRLTASVAISPNPYALDVNFGNLELTQFRVDARKPGRPDSLPASDFRLGGATSSGKQSVDLDYRNVDSPSTYVYHLGLRTGAINGFTPPPWVADFSSDNPTASQDANKTFNLDRFVIGMRRALSSLQQPLIAQWAVSVRKL